MKLESHNIATISKQIKKIHFQINIFTDYLDNASLNWKFIILIKVHCLNYEIIYAELLPENEQKIIDMKVKRIYIIPSLNLLL